MILIPARLLVKVTGAILVCLFFHTQPLQAQTTPVSNEYRVKAVFLYNFTQFVEWPATSFSSANAPFVIGILGDDPFGASIDETVANEKIGGHQLVVQRFRDVKDVKNCQILFINYADAERVKENLLLFTNHNTLTVGEAPNFVKTGGMIRFFTEKNKIRLQINPEAAKAAELTISSKLLRVSDIFDPKNQPK